MNAHPRESAQIASIFKTRSFQFLVDAVGAENIAIALESNMTRVGELLKGERFTPETAFHMETTLGLPHGFFDQPQPALAPETITRLKSPLDFIQADDEGDVDSQAPQPAATASVDQQPSVKDILSEKAQMPKRPAAGAARTTRNGRNEMAERSKPDSRPKSPASKRKASPLTPQQQPLALSDSVDVENIRRANLHVLTNRKGSKAKLGVVMSMSGSNMAHRLYGKKRMDGVEANRFTEGLGLPIGWLDTPRSAAEIPEAVARMLEPASRGRGSREQRAPLTAAEKNDEPPKLAETKTRTRRARTDTPGVAASLPPVAENTAEDKEALVVSPQDEASGFAAVPAGRPLSENEHETPAAIPAPTELPTATAVPDRHLGPHHHASVTSLDDLTGIEPIAEALLKTLAGKARTGRLDELKALELLQQAVRL